MPGSIQLALMVGPLALYFYILAVWQSARTPRIIPGQVDLLLLLCGIGGLVVFGPIGHVLVVRGTPFGTPSPWAWVALAASLGILSLPWLPRSFRRLVVYNIDPDSLDAALRDALGRLPGTFARTVRGFEDRAAGRGLLVEPTPWLRSVVVEAYGADAETLIGLVGRQLRTRPLRPGATSTAVAWIMLAFCMGLIAPVVLILLNRPQAREALRVLLERLNGG